LATLLLIFNNNIFPILLVVGSGYLAGKFLEINPRSLSQAAFYIFSPCLIFTSLTRNDLGLSDIWRMAALTALTLLLTGGLAWLTGRLLRLERRMQAALLLTVMFSNAGNYGLSLNRFAFGELALAYASLYFVISAVLMYTLGTIVASLGSAPLKQALTSLLKVPVIYAVLLAVAFNSLGGEQLPLPVDRAVTLLGDASIPVLLVLMGLQLQRMQWNGQNLALLVSNGLRLLIAPAVAFGLALVFGLSGAALQAAITESAMPTAVITTILATEFDVEPSFVTTAVFTSTLLSPFTLTPLLALLGA
jgi:predicted permease